ncbi:oxidoreductase [Streptomyces hoynatensis]|uniref:oxidoreductase n=1 Tax=Streptomyces hoynatensis TaxID=1141874 RepID=UPI0026A7742B
MAASLGMHSILIEADQVGTKLLAVAALENVVGGWRAGPELARAMGADIDRITAAGRCTLLRGRAVRVRGCGDRAEVRLDDGLTLTAAVVIVATGVGPVDPADTGWITAADGLALPPLWRARPEQLRGPVHVLGADRPLGTWLRAHPDARRPLTVLHPASDAYKAAEVADDDRVRLVQVRSLAVKETPSDGWQVDAELADGSTRSFIAATLLGNLGSTPAAIDGLNQGPDGYCPPELQHPRVLVAGDLRSSRCQRIITAQGSGAEAALQRYYEVAGVINGR